VQKDLETYDEDYAGTGGTATPTMTRNHSKKALSTNNPEKFSEQSVVR